MPSRRGTRLRGASFYLATFVPQRVGSATKNAVVFVLAHSSDHRPGVARRDGRGHHRGAAGAGAGGRGGAVCRAGDAGGGRGAECGRWPRPRGGQARAFGARAIAHWHPPLACAYGAWGVRMRERACACAHAYLAAAEPLVLLAGLGRREALVARVLAVQLVRERLVRCLRAGEASGARSRVRSKGREGNPL